MVDYPYANDFLMPLPANPVKAMCFKGFDTYKPPGAREDIGEITNVTKDTINRLINATGIYFNYENKTDYCVDWKSNNAAGNLKDEAWAVLTCNQLAMPFSCGDGTMFQKFAFNETDYIQGCETKYGLKPDFSWPMKEFGGANIARDFKHYSNIIFSNGNLDPWIAGGVTEYINLKLPVYIIQGGAHHLDLRLPNEGDCPDVVRVREHETKDLRRWIDEY